MKQLKVTCTTSTEDIKLQLSSLRSAILFDLLKAVQSTKSMKITFSETEAPRFYFDGGWRDIIQLRVDVMSPSSMSFGWHDERCTSNGANAFVYSAQISTEILVQFHELIYSKK